MTRRMALLTLALVLLIAALWAVGKQPGPGGQTGEMIERWVTLIAPTATETARIE